MLKNIGPGVLVAAAFIGPGTVTVCTLAGVDFGTSLLWALLLAMGATMILQEMSARIGLVTGHGLADVIRTELRPAWLRYAVIILVLGAIIVGNTAYEAGNIGGAVLGVEALIGTKYSVWYPWIIGFSAAALLWQGSYKALEKVFVSLVLLMSISFLLAALLTGPVLVDILEALFVPAVPEGSILTIIALVGTTVVPYNLFLHASLVNEKWKGQQGLQAARVDTVVSIALGGLVSMSIIVAASAIDSESIRDAADLAKGLEPLFGSAAKYCMGIGLFAAGITSSITAPLAAAYVAQSVFGWQGGLQSVRFRATWGIILFLGVVSLSSGIRPIEIIRFAQVANGMLLPIVAVFLFWVVNRTKLLGKQTNNLWQNILVILIIGLSLILGLKSVIAVFNG